MYLTETVQTGDWKNEKHVPEVEVKELGDNTYEVTACVGKEIAHPNTLEHHISWIKVFFLAEGSKLPVEIADFNFSAHCEGELYTVPKAVGTFKSEKKGTIQAISYCNIHGLWQNAIEL